MISKPVTVKALNNYTIQVAFEDGTQGAVDLRHLAHKGVFRQWDSDNLFAQVHLDGFGAIAWNEDLDMCPDSIYLHLKGLTFEQWKQQNSKKYAANQ